MLITKEVKTKWDSKNKSHYESRGYIFTKFQDVIYIKCEDLLPNSEMKVEVKCDYCGETHTKLWRKYITGRNRFPKDACKKCGIKKQNEAYFYNYGVRNFSQTEEGKIVIGNIKRKYSIEQVRLLFKKEGYELLTDYYINNSQKLEYICPKHGLKNITLNHFLYGKRCKECQHEKISDTQRHTDNDIVNIIKNYDDSLKITKINYTSYKKHDISLICQECGKEFTTQLTCILYGKNRCDHCSSSQSKSEFISETYFLDNKINYIKQISFDECRYINRLSFDFGIKQRNNELLFLLELDGQQHFKPIRFRGMTEKEAVKQFEENQIRDNIKNEYCKQNNIPLLRIPYWDFDKIGEILEKELQKYNLLNVN